jgi:hypothetical protein
MVIDNLESLNRIVVERIKKEGPLISEVFKAELSRHEIVDAPLMDLIDDASQWISDIRPSHLYINHGEFIRGGMNHIIKELKSKPSSNRALYSLISSKEINASQDEPIPSFLTFQCQIKKSILYCSVTFRALEASSFMRLNLEEIRQRIAYIIGFFDDISSVKLAIFSFHTYIKQNQTMLRKPLIDTYSVSKISSLLKTDSPQLKMLLDEKLKPSTVVDVGCFIKIKEIFEDDTPEKYFLKKAEFISIIEQVISSGEDYRDSRKLTSDDNNISHKIAAYTKAIECLRQAI